jgi:hypothetical protein
MLSDQDIAEGLKLCGAPTPCQWIDALEALQSLRAAIRKREAEYKAKAAASHFMSDRQLRAEFATRLAALLEPRP